RTPPDRILSLLEEHDVCRLFLGPWLLRSLIDAAATRGRGVGSITMIVSNGAPLTIDDVERAWEWFPKARVQSMYGVSEAGEIAAVDLFPGDDVSVPHPLALTIRADMRVKVVSDGRACRPGDQGEIWASTAADGSRYLDAPDLTASSFAVDDDGTP